MYAEFYHENLKNHLPQYINLCKDKKSVCKMTPIKTTQCLYVRHYPPGSYCVHMLPRGHKKCQPWQYICVVFFHRLWTTISLWKIAT